MVYLQVFFPVNDLILGVGTSGVSANGIAVSAHIPILDSQAILEQSTNQSTRPLINLFLFYFRNIT